MITQSQIDELRKLPCGYTCEGHIVGVCGEKWNQVLDALEEQQRLLNSERKAAGK